MADEEHAETAESTMPDAETVEEEKPHADEPTAVEDKVESGGLLAESVVAEDDSKEEREKEAVKKEDGEEEEEEETQAVVPEDMPPETIDGTPSENMRTDDQAPDDHGMTAVEDTDEPGDESQQPEYQEDEFKEEEEEEEREEEEEEEPQQEEQEQDEEEEEEEEEEAVAEDDTQQQPDSTEAEVVVPTVTDEEPMAAEASLELHEVAASLSEEEVLDDRSEKSEDELGEDLPQSPDQLADMPSEVMPYPSADDIDVLSTGDMPADLEERDLEVDELAEVDEADQPDPTRVTERVGPVQECPEIPTPPPLLQEGRDDIETPTDEPTVPSVLVCFHCMYACVRACICLKSVLLLPGTCIDNSVCPSICSLSHLFQHFHTGQLSSIYAAIY